MHYTPPEFWPRSTGETPRLGEGLAPSLPASTAALYALATLCIGLLSADLISIGFGFDSFSVWGMPLRPALIAALLGGVRFLYRSLDGLLSGKWGADLALALAIIAALVIGDPLTAASVICIALVGEAIEAWVWSAAQSTLHRLYAVAPSVTHRLCDNQETDIPIRDVLLDDLLAIRPGESVPCDGVVVGGEGRVDESLITGESTPIAKRIHDRVLAGSLLSAGWLTVQVDRVAAESTLQRLAELVRKAGSQRSPCERRADLFAKWFLPIVLVAAAVTAVGWRWKTGDWSDAWTPVLTVLVIACPCPLVLATPTAALAAVMRLARRGVVVRGTDALQRLSECDTFAFDKTGTLTTGAMSVTHVESLCALSPHDILRLAASAEASSEHPIGRAIVSAAAGRGAIIPRPSHVEILTGRGIRAEVHMDLAPLFPGVDLPSGDGPHKIVVGSSRWIGLNGLGESAVPSPSTSVFVGLETLAATANERIAPSDVRPLGRIDLSDEIDPAVATVFRRLKSRGKTLAILSGDSDAAVKSVVDRIGGADEVHSSLLPEHKVAWIEKRRQSGGRIASVGDGMNDAPALAAAHVGLAVVTPSNALTAAAGDVLLMSRPIAVLPEVCFVAQEFVATVDRGIVWFGLAANGLGVAAAMLGLFPPIVGAVLHEATAAAVMLLALRLLWVRDSSESSTSPVPVALPGESTFQSAVESTAMPGEPTSILDWLAPEAWLAAAWSERFRLSQCAVLLALLVWLGGNIHCLAPEEQGLVLRFGRVQAELTGGWHWRWPYPFESVRRESTQRVQRITLGFRPSEQPPREAPRVIEWTTDHRLTNEQPAPEESAWLVHDELAVEGTAELQFQIVNLRSFAVDHRSPREWLAAAFQSTLVELVSAAPLGDLLTVDRRRLEAECRRGLQRAADQAGVGVRITGVFLLDVHPPVSVVPEYRDVGDALEGKDEQMLLGQSTAIRRLSTAVGGRVAERLAPELFGGASRVDLPMHEDWPAWSQAVTALEPNGATWLAGDTAAMLLNADAERRRVESNAQAIAARTAAFVPVSQASRRSTRTELFWGGLESVLKGRPLTIVDSSVADRWRWWHANSPTVQPPRENKRPDSSRSPSTDNSESSRTDIDSPIAETPLDNGSEDHEP